MGFIGRPGFRTSEFIAAVLNVVVQVALAYNDTVTNGTAVQLSVAGAIAFILSRGLAKYEPRPPILTPPPAPPQPPAA